jgi:hypothetical protein
LKHMKERCQKQQSKIQVRCCVRFCSS